MLVIEKHSLSFEIEDSISRHGGGRECLLPVLQDVQAAHGYVPDFAQQEIARLLDIHPVEVYSVVTFYAFLSTEPKGRNIVRLCRTISCDLSGKDAVIHAIERELGIRFGQMTRDKKFSLEFANCMGMCDQGPAMLINDEVFTNLTPQRAVDILKRRN